MRAHQKKILETSDLLRRLTLHLGCCGDDRCKDPELKLGACARCAPVAKRIKEISCDLNAACSALAVAAGV